MNEKAIVRAHELDGEYTVTVTRGAGMVRIDAPVTVNTPDGANTTARYQEVTHTDSGIKGTSIVHLPDDTTLRIVDIYSYPRDEPSAVAIDRRVRVERKGTAAGIQVGFNVVSELDGACAEDWQFYVPGSLYNRNDSDGDGVEDYFGTLLHEHRDDYNAALTVMAWDPKSTVFYALSRTTLPTYDNLVSNEGLTTGVVVQETDIGSLGTVPLGQQVQLRAFYPFQEEVSHSLSADKQGWSGYLPLSSDLRFSVDYELRIGMAPNLTEGIWNVYERQRALLDPSGITRVAPLEDVIDHRMQLTQLYFREWTTEEDPLRPAGYLVHFSPRNGETLGSLIEFGFSGDQALLAYTQLKWSKRKDVPLYRLRALSVLDFFTRAFQEDNGFSHGIYDPIRHQFTHWFTGILMPFQYAEGEEVRGYVGEQIYDSLSDVAQSLKKIEGNYLRTMCESFFPLLLSYQFELSHGIEHPHWLESGKKFGEFLLNTQADDGSWYRGYSPAGEGLVEPEKWFGASYLEQKSGAIFPIPTLSVLWRLTGDNRYLDAIRKAARFIIDTYIDPVIYVGGLNDTTHNKSVKTDSVGLMFTMRSMRFAYEVTGDKEYLQAAVNAAKVLCSWVYVWNVPFPEDTLMARARFESKGWVACDVLPSGSYLDNEFLEFTGDLVAISKYANEPRLLDIAELVEHGMQHAVSLPNDMQGYVAPGIQCEGVMTGYWLSRPNQTKFSGAVAKRKGDDNDTCNALTNGQAAYGLYELEDTFGTSDFNRLRTELFQSH